MTRLWALALVVASFYFGSSLCGQSSAGGSLASASPPMYPLAAKAAGIEGKVELEGVIGKDGLMRDLRVIHGPAELRQAGLDAVVHWRYHPYVHDGQVVEVKTTVTVNFSMGTKKEKAAAQAKAQAELAKAAPVDDSQGTEPGTDPKKE